MFNGKQTAFARQYVNDLCAVLRKVPFADIGRALQALETALAERKRIFLAGNGGSASTASHMANDLMKGVANGNGRGCRVIALTDNVPIITAIANDESYEEVFSAQLEQLGETGDLLMVISGSGNSPNIVRAVEVAQKIGMTTIAFLGMDGGRVAEIADVSIVVPSNEYGPIEDVHLVFNHLFTDYLRAHSNSEVVVVDTLPRPAIFLDRDGVLIKDVTRLTSHGQVELYTGAPEAIRKLREMGFVVVVATNQAVVARGWVEEQEVAHTHGWIQELLKRAGGGIIDKFYFCPHHPNGTLPEYRVACDCRKPRPGLLLKAAKELNIDLKRSYMIGDRLTDILAGQRAGCTTILVQTGMHNEAPIETVDPIDSSVQPDFVCSDLVAAVEIIMDNGK